MVNLLMEAAFKKKKKKRKKRNLTHISLSMVVHVKGKCLSLTSLPRRPNKLTILSREPNKIF